MWMPLQSVRRWFGTTEPPRTNVKLLYQNGTSSAGPGHTEMIIGDRIGVYLPLERTLFADFSIAFSQDERRVTAWSNGRRLVTLKKSAVADEWERPVFHRRLRLFEATFGDGKPYKIYRGPYDAAAGISRPSSPGFPRRASPRTAAPPEPRYTADVDAGRFRNGLDDGRGRVRNNHPASALRSAGDGPRFRREFRREAFRGVNAAETRSPYFSPAEEEKFMDIPPITDRPGARRAHPLPPLPDEVHQSLPQHPADHVVLRQHFDRQRNEMEELGVTVAHHARNAIEVHHAAIAELHGRYLRRAAPLDESRVPALASPTTNDREQALTVARDSFQPRLSASAISQHEKNLALHGLRQQLLHSYNMNHKYTQRVNREDTLHIEDLSNLSRFNKECANSILGRPVPRASVSEHAPVAVNPDHVDSDGSSHSSRRSSGDRSRSATAPVTPARPAGSLRGSQGSRD